MIYAIESKLGYVKIGVTDNLKRRISGIQSGHPVKLKIITTWDLEDEELERRVEQRLHRQLARYKTSGEWFKLSLEGRVWVEEIEDWYLRGGCTKKKDFSKPEYSLPESPIRRRQIEEIVDINLESVQRWWECDTSLGNDDSSSWWKKEESNTLEKWCAKMMEMLYCEMESDEHGEYSLGIPMPDGIYDE
jgi:hypothetical protein